MDRRSVLASPLLALPASTAQAPGSFDLRRFAESGLFNQISSIDIPENIVAIHTIGWSTPGLGGAQYCFSPLVDRAFVQRFPACSAISRNGRGFILREPEINVAMAGARVQAKDNFFAIQQAIDFVAAAGGGQVFFPAGEYHFAQTLIMRNGVDLRGAGKDAAILRFDAAGLAISGTGTAKQRKIFRLRDLSIIATHKAPDGVGLALSWNQRSLPMLDHVKIAGFGQFGIDFVANNWLVTFRDIEITDCGRAGEGGCGIHRQSGGADFDALSDVKFFGLVIEACGNPNSAGGAMTLHCAPPFATQGIWVHGACIEGNAGLCEISVTNADHLSIEQTYFEVERFTASSRDGLHLENGHAVIGASRFATAAENKGGAAIVAQGTTSLLSQGNLWDADFHADIVLSSSAQLQDVSAPGSGPRVEHR